MNDYIEQFRTAIAGTGLPAPDEVVADKEIHRYSTNGKPKDDSGWYILHSDGIPAGSFGCWRLDRKFSWCAKNASDMTAPEQEDHRRKMDAIRLKREADTAIRQQQAGETAAAKWAGASEAHTHPYLTRKGVKSYGLKIDGSRLLVPMMDTSGKLWGLQGITPDGGKLFPPGGRVKGCFHTIGEPDGVLVVCEGYATGATIHEATGHAVAIAFNAGNLMSVAQALRQQHPSLKLILAADDDWKTDGNPGLAKATEAAQAVAGSLAIPSFPAGRGDKDTDFNDLHRLAGADSVRSSIAGAGGSQTWAEPTPLPNALPPVAPFDLQLLPEALRAWVDDIAHRMQCPPDFVAVGAVVAISSLIGARAVVAPKARDDWRVVPNLWGLIVGRPGVMKSPALGEVLKPMDHLEGIEREQWLAAHGAWQVDSKLATMTAEANEKQARGLAGKDPAKARALLEPVEMPPEPKARRYMVNDATVEKLADLLTVNEWGLLVYRDEIHGLLCSMDRPGQEGSRGFYLTAYDGNRSHAVDRIGRGESFVQRVCLAMLGGTQPGKLHSYVREAVAGGAGDDGLLQRFGLTVWPDVNRDFVYVDRRPDAPAREAAWAVFDRLSQLQPAGDTDPHEWRFTPEAQALFEEWLVPFEIEIRGEELHPALVSHLSKYRKLVPALALIFALVDTPDSGNMIDEPELLRALDWADYLRSHAERVYTAAVTPETTGASELLSKIRSGRLSDGDGVLLESFEPWKAAVKHWAGLGTPDAVRKAAELLADYGWLKREVVPTGAKGGRPSERYLIHPVLLKGGV
jgi:putative DNA primase/helicase